MKPAELDLWQYRLSEETQPGALAVGRFWLELGPGLPAFPLIDAAGIRCGLVIGFAIDLAARRYLQDHCRARTAIAAGRDAFIKDVLWNLAGRFLVFLDDGEVTRAYPDSSAHVPLVYDPKLRIAGQSAHALFDDATYEARFDRALYTRLGVEGEGWYPAGLTAHAGLLRLLPGHYLDLDTWTPHRFWPLGPIVENRDMDAIIDETVALVQAQMEAVIASPKRLALGLTAGHETRALLSCARPYLDQIDMVTVVGAGRTTTDTTVARRIVKDFGLRHIELPKTEATAEATRLFIRRGGHCNADSNARFHPSVHPIAHSHIFLGGVGGEVGRAFLWRESDRPDTPITVEGLNSRFGLVQTDTVMAAIEAWLADLPVSDAYGILDLAYLENRMGPWYALQFGTDPTLQRISPLFTFRGVELMLSMPPEWKRESRLGHAIVKRLWPELLVYPFNSLGKWRDLYLKLQRVASDPKLVAKKLRKLRA